MSSKTRPSLTPLWTVLRFQWKAAQRRRQARQSHQSELMGRKPSAGRSTTPLLGALMFIVLSGLHFMLAWSAVEFSDYSRVCEVVEGQRYLLAHSAWSELQALDQATRHLEYVRQKGEQTANQAVLRASIDDAMKWRDRSLRDFLGKAADEARLGEGRAAALRQALEKRWLAQGMAGFGLEPGRTVAAHLRASMTEPAPLASMATLCIGAWMLLLLCQGEGLELDIQRRRYPMWEWLLSHPVNPAHVFYVDLLMPLLANPVYVMGPVFLWCLLGAVHGFWFGLVGAVVVGFPMVLALSAAHKAIETYALLRLDLRKRGALLGILSWIGYVIMFVPALLFQFRRQMGVLLRFGDLITPWIPAWPVRWLLYGWGERASLWQAVLTWWILIAGVLALAVWSCSKYTIRGFQGGEGSPPESLVGGRRLLARGGKRMLWRKELLWLQRDRGAIVQVVLIPLTIGLSQVLNLGGLFRDINTSWSVLCGLALLCGTYFLLVLGPRSLLSEGPALWISLTWPRGLEELLREKARLWSMVANVIVLTLLGLVLCFYPGEWWKILAIAFGWVVFSSTLALKSVCLVTPPSSSGEPERPDRWMQWMAMLGTLGFASGVMTSTWHSAVMGIVFSSLVAVAMWERMRARLPYLFDPWSMESVPSPTLVEVCVGTALLMEFLGAAMVIAHIASGTDEQWMVLTLSYGVVTLFFCIFMQSYLSDRQVTLKSIIFWEAGPARYKTAESYGLAVLGGLLLALIAWLYLTVLSTVPSLAHLMQAQRMQLQGPTAFRWTFVLAVFMAPLAEEYVFRGLLFRTLERDLKDWRAFVLSAVCFTVLHPPLAWVPVFLLGLSSAIFFRQTRNLGPCVLLHATYNAAVLWIQFRT